MKDEEGPNMYLLVTFELLHSLPASTLGFSKMLEDCNFHICRHMSS